jgi:hypothetical protein
MNFSEFLRGFAGKSRALVIGGGTSVALLPMKQLASGDDLFVVGVNGCYLDVRTDLIIGIDRVVPFLRFAYSSQFAGMQAPAAILDENADAIKKAEVCYITFTRAESGGFTDAGTAALCLLLPYFRSIDAVGFDYHQILGKKAYYYTDYVDRRAAMQSLYTEEGLREFGIVLGEDPLTIGDYLTPAREQLRVFLSRLSPPDHNKIRFFGCGARVSNVAEVRR